MLVKPKYEKGDIVSFKLVNGDEVIGQIDEETPDTYVLSKPTQFVHGPKGAGLIQAMFSGDINKNVPLNKAHIMMHAPTAATLRDHYIEITTGIQPVTKGGIIV